MDGLDLLLSCELGLCNSHYGGWQVQLNENHGVRVKWLIRFISAAGPMLQQSGKNTSHDRWDSLHDEDGNLECNPKLLIS